MFQSIRYVGSIPELKSYIYIITDSDFGVVDVIVAENKRFWDLREGALERQTAIIREYSKRKLNVAANLVMYFRFYEKHFGISVATQMQWLLHQELYTPELKADLQKYLTLI